MGNGGKGGADKQRKDNGMNLTKFSHVHVYENSTVNPPPSIPVRMGL